MTCKSASKFTLLALLLFAWAIPAAAQMTKVAIGYSGISADQLVIWVAKDTGIFAKTISMLNPSISPAGRRR